MIKLKTFDNSRPLNAIVVLAMIGSLGFVISREYYNLILAYFDTLKIDEYSYLIILVPFTIWIMLDLLMKHFEPVGISVERALFSLSLFFASLIFYAIYGIYSSNIIQYGILSIIFLVWGFIILLYRPVEVKYYVFMIILSIPLIPIPLSWINFISVYMSRFIGFLAATIGGATYNVVGNHIYIRVIDPMGSARVFEISYACSGIISFSSILAISPLLMYLVVNSDTSIKEKVLGITLSIITASVVALLGNFIRLLLVIATTRYFNYEAAMNIFHQLPSIIYVAIAVVSAFYVLNRFIGNTLWKNVSVPSVFTRAERYKVPLVLGIIFMVLIANAHVSLVDALYKEVYAEKFLYVPSIESLLDNPASVIFNNTNVEVINTESVPSLRSALGVSIIKKILIRYNKKLFSGYIEIAETPDRFHGWYVCLTFQEYRIIRSWKITSNVTIDYMLLSKNTQLLLLGYTIYRVKVLIGNTTTTAYVRVSLFAPVVINNYEETMIIIKDIFDLIASHTKVIDSRSPTSLFEKIVLAENILLTTNLFIVIGILSKKYLYTLLKKIVKSQRRSI